MKNKETSHFHVMFLYKLEAAPRVELGNRGFADLRLNHLAMPPTNLMERKTRFELATLALARRCSTAELLPQR